MNGRKNPSIYNKILGHSRSWCMIEIILTKSRLTFYGIFYDICWRGKTFDLGQIPLFVNNKEINDLFIILRKWLNDN